MGDDSHPSIHGVSVSRIAGSRLFIEWDADEFCYSMRGYWGMKPSQALILKERNILFVGWTDGDVGTDMNSVVCDDPAPDREDLYFVLEDHVTKARSWLD